MLKKECKFDSVQQIAHKFCIELQEALNQEGIQSSIAQLWAPTEAQPSASNLPAGLIKNLVEYNAQGKAEGAEKLSLQTAGGT